MIFSFARVWVFACKLHPLILNLTKYIGEVAAAVTEAKLKMSDVQSFLEVCSVLHSKYADFAPSLMENWKKILTVPKGQQTISNPSKLRVDIR